MGDKLTDTQLLSEIYPVSKDGLFLWGLRVVCYVDENGEQQWDYKFDGEFSWAEITGHLELLKSDILEAWQSGEGLCANEWG